MEKTKKTVNAVGKKAEPVKRATRKPATKSTQTNVEPVKVNVQEAEPKKAIMFNQDLNLLIGLLSLLTIFVFCLEFQGGAEIVTGWELFLKGGTYSSVFKWVMILYVVSLFVDCVLAVRFDVERSVANCVEKAIYMVTLLLNIVVLSILYSLISKFGIGLIIFLILSIVSIIVKLARIYTQSK